MPAPLSHIRVLDLTRVLAGPWAAQNLGDLGAEVIKVEKPHVGDDTRGYGPPFIKDPDGKDTPDAIYFLSANRNKKSITVDISTAEGQAIVLGLCEKCDVVIENYKVGTLKRYGLAYDDVRKVNPRVIYCSITGFGQDGPDADQAGYDLLFQGMGGLMSMTGEPDGVPGGGPQKVGIAITDVLAGMYASLAVTAAISHRDRTGEGQYIDIGLLDTIVAFTANQSLYWLDAGIVPQRWGTGHPQIVPYQMFPTSDGHMILAVGSDAQFQRFCGVIDRLDLASDPRFERNADRVRNRASLVTALSAILATRTKREWLQLLKPTGIPCGPINTMPEVFEEPQVRHRKLQLSMPHATGRPVPTLASPMRFSKSPVEYRDAPPLLGQHTDEILQTLLSKTADEIAALRGHGIV